MIAIHGAYYDNNFGDLLLLKLYEKWVRLSTDMKVVYPMVPENQIRRFREHFQDGIVGFEGRKSWKALLYAGGGHFGEPASGSSVGAVYKDWNKRFFRRHVLPAELCLWTGVPYAVMGVGAGPLSNFFVRTEARRILANAKMLSVRDLESASFVRDVLKLRSDVKVIPDAAFSMEKSDIPAPALEAVDAVLGDVKGAPLLGIHHPRDFLVKTSQGEAIRSALVETLKGFPEIVPVVFADNGMGDYSEPCEKLSSLIRDTMGRNCISVPFQGVWETVALLSMLSAVVTTKLHVGIVAYTMGVYSESFALHSKVQRFYSQIGRSSQCLMLKESTRENCLEKFKRVATMTCNQSSIEDESWEWIRLSSKSGFDMVASFVRGVY